jgi:hypothetical protein
LRPGTYPIELQVRECGGNVARDTVIVQVVAP